jgi:hypothetical protein
MEWFEPKKQSGNGKPDPGFAAICISLVRSKGVTDRVRMRLSEDFIRRGRLQKGDKIQAGLSDDGSLLLRRNSVGNAICGTGFSDGESGSTGTPYVAFQISVYPAIMQWAELQPVNEWIQVIDMGTHFVC